MLSGCVLHISSHSVCRYCIESYQVQYLQCISCNADGCFRVFFILFIFIFTVVYSVLLGHHAR